MDDQRQSDSDTASPGTSGNVCCLALSAAIGQEKVALASTAEYTEAVRSYFSVQQESMHPACIIRAENAEDVSAAVKALVQLHDRGEICPFAVRSGGHTSWPGASNIEGGAVIDMRLLNAVEVSVDRKTVVVGVGATWGDVYKVLDPLGLSVNGGRASTPGVGGLTLGGGVSYTSPRYGWTCDTVSQFEIVLADGSIAQVDDNSNPDLMWAMRGGVNNFGIVTRIVLETFEQGPIWSGTLYSLATAADQAIHNFVRLNSPTAYDEYASAITSFNYTQASGFPTIANLLQYTKEVTTDKPATFLPFFEIPLIYNSITVAKMTETTQVTASLNPAGVRTTTLVTTLASREPVIKAAFDQWNKSYPALKNVTSLIFSLVLEPLPPAIYKKHAETNALGFASRTESLVIVELFASWANAADDGLVNTTLQELLKAINSRARELDGHDPYLFANYAGKDQEVIASYGTASVERMRRVSQAVDPKGIWSKLVPGGYKISPQ